MAYIGNTLTITWSSTDWIDPDGAPLPVKIELSRDGGGVWETIVASTSDDGTYDWVVTGPESADCVLRFSDPADPTVNFLGDTFAIATAPVLSGGAVRNRFNLALAPMGL